MAKTEVHAVIISGGIELKTSFIWAKWLINTRPNLLTILVKKIDSQNLRMKGYEKGFNFCISGASPIRELGSVI